MPELPSLAWAIHLQIFLETQGLWICRKADPVPTSFPVQDSSKTAVRDPLCIRSPLESPDPGSADFPWSWAQMGGFHQKGAHWQDKQFHKLSS